MMSAMPAYAIRKEREKKKSKSTKVVPGRGVYQLRPPRNSRNSISSMKGVYKRPNFTKPTEDENHLKVSETYNYNKNREKVPLYYAGTALMCAGLVFVFVSVAINDRNTHGAGKPIRYTGLALLVLGGLLCLVKVLCFSTQDASNIVFIRRTDDAVIEETTSGDPPSEEPSSQCAGTIEGATMLPGQPNNNTDDGFVNSTKHSETNKNVLLNINGAFDETEDGNYVSATSGTMLQMNGLSPSDSSHGASSTQILITPDSVTSAKF